MIRKIIIPLILLLILNSCGYSPIYSTKYQDFKIDNISFKGERKINEILRKRLVGYTKITSAENIYDVIINSSLQKNVDSKDKKGNPTQFSLRVNVDLIVVDKFDKTFQINFNENAPSTQCFNSQLKRLVPTATSKPSIIIGSNCSIGSNVIIRNTIVKPAPGNSNEQDLTLSSALTHFQLGETITNSDGTKVAKLLDVKAD